MMVRRAKSKFKNARAAWADIAKVRRISLRTHTIRRTYTASFYQWEVLVRRQS